MSNDAVRKIDAKAAAVKTDKAAASDVSKLGFAAKIEPGTLITAIQRDLVRVHDFAMSQERPTTYVLSDFNLQLKAVVTQEADKMMVVLPSKPGEIDPSLMSTVNITLKPIPLAVKPVAGTRPVEAIEGIGPVIGARLRDAGINTISDLAQSPPQDLVKLNVPRKKADEFISMAKMMVKGDIAGVEGVDEQAAELLVVAGKVDSKEKLAELNPEELYNTLTEAMKARKVRVPQSFRLTLDNVRTWTASAKTIVGRARGEEPVR